MDSSTTFEDDDWRAQATAFTGDAFETNLAVVEDLKAFAAELGVQVSQLAIAWTLHQPGARLIVGARSDRNIEASAAAADVELSDDDLARIDEIASRGVQVEGAMPEGVV